MSDNKKRLQNQGRRCDVTGKVMYATKKAAKNAIISFNKTREKKMEQYYFCVECEEFHLTSQTKKYSATVERGINYLKDVTIKNLSVEQRLEYLLKKNKR